MKGLLSQYNQPDIYHPYSAPNVDSPVFRFFGRVLKPDFGMTGEENESLLDFGCGQGAAVDFFNRHGFRSYGVDISSQSLTIARHRYPEIADHFAQIDPEPAPNDTFFDQQFDVIIAIQSLYYLSDRHLEDRIRSLYESLNPGGVFYATMMSVESGYYDQSRPAEDGLREITIENDRLSIDDYYVNFTRDENHLEERFEPLEPVHTGFYSERFRSDEPSGHHLTYVGTK